MSRDPSGGNAFTYIHSQPDMATTGLVVLNCI